MGRTPKKQKKPIQFFAGIVILILGVVLILTWWQETVVLFKAMAAMAIALSGMVLLYMASQE